MGVCTFVIGCLINKITLSEHSCSCVCVASQIRCCVYSVNKAVTITRTTNISCIASLLFINPRLWPYGIVKCLLNVHFSMSPEIVGYLHTFCLLFLGLQ